MGMERDPKNLADKKLSNKDIRYAKNYLDSAMIKGKRKRGKEVIKIGTWNIRTLLEVGKLNELAMETEKSGTSIMAIQEVRWGGQGQINKQKFSFLYSGEDKQGKNGVGFLVTRKLANKIIDFKPINGRSAYLRIEAKPFNLSLINIYAPTDVAEGYEKDRTYEMLENVLEQCPKQDTVIMLGDFNAQIGKEDFVSNVAGKHTIHERTNDNGQRLCNLAATNGMIICSTKFKHDKNRKLTWISPDKKTVSQIDHILVAQKRQSSIRNIRTYRGTTLESDHFLVQATIKQKINRAVRNKSVRIKWDVEKLKFESVKAQYEEHLENNLRVKDMEDTEINKAWDKIKKEIVEAAERYIGQKKQQPRNEWWNTECENIVKKKGIARAKWIRTESKEDKESYQRKRKEANKLIREVKREWMNEKLNAIENERKNKNTKVYYAKINMERKTSKNIIKGIKNKDGIAAENEEQGKKIWKDYFTTLLNEDLNETEVDDNEPNKYNVEEPTFEEFMEVLHKSKNGKAAGNDSINIEMIKYGGDQVQKKTYSLIKRIWEQEEMPEEWESGTIVTIHKKGDKTQCKNFRGVTLLNTCYKLLSALIHKRLTETARDLIGEYQYGFRKGRSTIDAIHTIKQILEKAYDYKMELDILFIDFRQAFDSIKRNKLLYALKEMKIPAKLRRLIRMTMKSSKMNVITEYGITDSFEINKGVRQGDALSATLFNLALEYVLRKVSKKGTLRTRGEQIIAYADDIAVITKRRQIMKDILKDIDKEGAELGLRINNEKTKIMRTSSDITSSKIRINQYKFDRVDSFKYLGVEITSKGARQNEIKEKIQKSIKMYHTTKRMMKSKILSYSTKINIYKTIIRPIMTYAAETMTMTKKEENQLLITERKIIRAILGPKKIGENEYVIRLNSEIEQIIEENIVDHIKKQRLNWLGHVWRRDEDDPIKAVVEWKPGKRKGRGRPRATWLHEVEEDLRKMGIKEWKRKVEDRKQWRNLISKEIRNIKASS